MKTKPTMLKYLTFALSLADVIEIIVSRNSADEVNQIVGAVIIKNNFSEKQTQLDLTLDGLTYDQSSNFIKYQLDKSITIRKLSTKDYSW